MIYLKLITYLEQTWWCTSIIPVLRLLRQEDSIMFEASLDYISRPCLSKQANKPYLMGLVAQQKIEFLNFKRRQ
jgi:hypothetical protein